MARSVGAHHDAVETVYLYHESEHYDDWGWFIEDLQGVIGGRYGSFYKADGWHGREGRTILRNSHAEVVVYSYMDLVTVNLVPRENYDYPSEGNLSRGWCERVAANFRELMHQNFDCLELVSRASNGEAMYRRVNYAEEA